jgi:hypothetical protein
VQDSKTGVRIWPYPDGRVVVRHQQLIGYKQSCVFEPARTNTVVRGDMHLCRMIVSDAASVLTAIACLPSIAITA